MNTHPIVPTCRPLAAQTALLSAIDSLAWGLLTLAAAETEDPARAEAMRAAIPFDKGPMPGDTLQSLRADVAQATAHLAAARACAAMSEQGQPPYHDGGMSSGDRAAVDAIEADECGLSPQGYIDALHRCTVIQAEPTSEGIAALCLPFGSLDGHAAEALGLLMATRDAGRAPGDAARAVASWATGDQDARLMVTETESGPMAYIETPSSQSRICWDGFRLWAELPWLANDGRLQSAIYATLSAAAASAIEEAQFGADERPDWADVGKLWSAVVAPPEWLDAVSVRWPEAIRQAVDRARNRWQRDQGRPAPSTSRAGCIRAALSPHRRPPAQPAPWPPSQEYLQQAAAGSPAPAYRR